MWTPQQFKCHQRQTYTILSLRLPKTVKLSIYSNSKLKKKDLCLNPKSPWFKLSKNTTTSLLIPDRGLTQKWPQYHISLRNENHLKLEWNSRKHNWNLHHWKIYSQRIMMIGYKNTLTKWRDSRLRKLLSQIHSLCRKMCRPRANGMKKILLSHLNSNKLLISCEHKPAQSCRRLVSFLRISYYWLVDEKRSEVVKQVPDAIIAELSKKFTK